MEKNIIITILPSFFLKIFDEIHDNPDKYSELRKFQSEIKIIMFLSTLLYISLGSGYSFLLFMHGIFCCFQKQIDEKNYVYGMVLLFLGIIINNKNQIKSLLSNIEGIKYLLFTFIFVYFEEKLFPEEVSKAKVITRMLFIISGLCSYYFVLRKIDDKEIKTMLISNLFASISYYTVSVGMKLSDKKNNPLKEKKSYIEEMIKRIYHLFF